MKKLIYLFLFLTSSAYAQEVSIGTSFMIEFKNPDKDMTFSIISKQAYPGILSSAGNDGIFLKNKPKENQIFCVFAQGKFGSQIGSMLVMVSGLKSSLTYNLRIKTAVNAKLEKTSVSQLFRNIKSVEYWPYNVQTISFDEFKIAAMENFSAIQIEKIIDSTCIKNIGRNTEQAEQEFEHHLKLITSQLESNSVFEVSKAREYENSVEATDISRGNMWTLSTGIYPNHKQFVFGNPLTFKRIECPYFKNTVDYIYTKVEQNIKVVSFEWKMFEPALGISLEPEMDLTPKFVDKYNFLIKAVSKQLGKPLNIK